MADFTPIFQAAGAQYGVDPAMLRALAMKESSMNPTAINPASGASGLMGFMPATAKSYGINPLDPEQAIPAAARMFRENLDRFGGNVEQAVAAHFAGPDQKLWGPKTSQYVDQVSGIFGKMKQGSPAVMQPQAGADPLLSMAKGMQNGQSAAQSQSAPAAGDPLLAMAQSVAAGKGPTQAATNPPVGAPQVAGQWQSPGSFLMGIGDAVQGGVQSLAHGGAWLANKIAPSAQFTQDLNAALPQIDQTIANHEQQYQAARQIAQPQNLSSLITGQKPQPSTDWGRMAGNVVGAAPLALAAPETAGMGLLARTGIGAAMGAANSALMPVTDTTAPYADQKRGQMLASAATGGAAVPIASAIGSAVSGVGTAAARRLADAGVTMTPGQILGGLAQRTEDKLTSIPVLGDFIKNAQQRSVQSFNRATYQGALDPIGAQLPRNIAAGSDGIAYVRGQIGNVYNSIEPRAQFVADQNFGTDLAGIRNTLAQNAPGALPQFDAIVQNQITGKLQNGSMTGAQWGDTRSMIDTFARNQIRGNANADQWALHDALTDLNGAVNEGVGRASPPDVLPALGRANAAYAQYKQIERAAGSVGASNNGNIFTAAQYANGVRNGATSFQKATNSGLNGRMAADAADVLGSKYPDSGTVGRSLLTLGLGAAAGHAAAPGVVIPGAVGIGLGSLPYTTYGQRLAQALLMNRPAIAAPVGNAISRFGPGAGVLLAPSIARSSN